MTISPKTDVWLPFLGTWFNGTMTEDVVWYQRYSSERSANTTYGLNWKLPLTRFTATLGASRASTRERQGYEIDERAPRTLNNYFADVSVNVSRQTRPSTSGSRARRPLMTRADIFEGIKLAIN